MLDIELPENKPSNLFDNFEPIIWWTMIGIFAGMLLSLAIPTSIFFR